MNGRRQALEFRLDAVVVVEIQIGDQFLLEVLHRLKFLKIEQFTLEQAEEVFIHGIIQTVALSAHTLNDAVVGELLLVIPVLVIPVLVIPVLVLPALIGVQNGNCPRGQPARSAVDHIQDS